MRLTRMTVNDRPYSDNVVRAEPSPRRRSRRVKQDLSADKSFPGVLEDVQPPEARTVANLKREAVKWEDSLQLEPGTSSVQRSPNKKSTRKSKPIARPLDIPLAAPFRWADAYAAIKDMRSRIIAPVDTMGCDQAKFKERDPKVRFFIRVLSLSLYFRHPPRAALRDWACLW